MALYKFRIIIIIIVLFLLESVTEIWFQNGIYSVSLLKVKSKYKRKKNTL